MGDFLTSIVEWLSALPVFWAYFMILIIAYGENVLPPIPGDMIIVFGGYLVGIGRLDVFPVVVLSTIGGTVGFMSMYAVGHRIGKRVNGKRGSRWMPVHRVERAREMLARWGFSLILANRFLAGLRSVISLSAGMAGMAPGRAAVFSGVSAFVWSILLVALGYYLGDHWQQVSTYLKTYGTIITLVIVAFVVLQLILGYLSRKSDRKTEAPDGNEASVDE